MPGVMYILSSLPKYSRARCTLMGQMKKKPKIKGNKIRTVRSFKPCFQFLCSMAKRAPILEIINKMGIRQILIMLMKSHSNSRDWSFWIKKRYKAQGWKLTTTRYTIRSPRANTLSQSISYLLIGCQKIKR